MPSSLFYLIPEDSQWCQTSYYQSSWDIQSNVSLYHQPKKHRLRHQTLQVFYGCCLLNHQKMGCKRQACNLSWDGFLQSTAGTVGGSQNFPVFDDHSFSVADHCPPQGLQTFLGRKNPPIRYPLSMARIFLADTFTQLFCTERWDQLVALDVFFGTRIPSSTHIVSRSSIWSR